MRAFEPPKAYYPWDAELDFNAESVYKTSDVNEYLQRIESETLKLKYEMITARFRYFYLLAYHYACEGEAKDGKKSKCTRIAKAYEARAIRIKGKIK